MFKNLNTSTLSRSAMAVMLAATIVSPAMAQATTSAKAVHDQFMPPYEQAVQAKSNLESGQTASAAKALQTVADELKPFEAGPYSKKVQATLADIHQIQADIGMNGEKQLDAKQSKQAIKEATKVQNTLHSLAY